MSSSPVSVACYKFEDFSEDGNYEDYYLVATDGQGTIWQLYFTANPIMEQDDGILQSATIVCGDISICFVINLMT